MTSQVERLTGNSRRSLYHTMFTYLSDEDVDRAVVSIAFKTFIHIMPHTIEQKLPEELLNNIVSFTSRDTFSSLSRTTKTINRLATPHFYSDVFFRSDDHLLELTYLMLTSPIHARLVKTFTMPNTWASSGEHTIGWSRSRHEGIESVLRTKCAEWTSSDAEAVRIFRLVESGTNEDAVLAVLLSSLPNLRKLDINFGHYNGHADFVTVWSAIVRGTREPALVTNERTPSCLARATRSISSPGPLDVMVTGADDKYPHSPDHFAAFMHTPNLRSIYGWRTGDADIEPMPETDACAKLKPRSCPVEYIELRTSKLHSSNLRFLLDAAIPGKLKTFNYEIGCTWAWCRVEHPQIMTSLRPHHDTLETLGLSHEDFYPYEMGHESDVPSVCSFTSFVALKRLKVAPVFVWGHEGLTSKYELDRPQTKEMLWKALPGNLEDLWITRAHQQDVQRYDARDRFVPDCLLPALDLVVQNKPEAFGKLAHLRIELPPLMWKEEWFDTLDSVCRLAASYGITTTIILFDLCDRWSELAVEKAWGWNEDILWEPLRYSINRESAKVWVDEAAQTDLGQTLKDLKARFEGEMEKYEDVKRRRGAMGPLCRDCQYSPAYDPAAQVDMSELKRFVEDRLQSKSCWRGGLSVLCCEDI